MRALLQPLKPGTRFRVDELGTTGVLVKASECRAVVRRDAAVETVEFTDGHGAQRLGREVPTEIHTVRPATTDEIDLMKWHNQMVARDAEWQARRTPA